MISDLRKLWRFQKAVDDRTTMLLRLRNGETLKRRVQLGVTIVKTTPTNLTVHSEGCVVGGMFQTTYSKREWGTAQWKLLPNSLLPQLGYEPLRKKALALTFGITSHEALAAAWELTPWSWLADWFGNTGDLIAATNNSVGCTWHNVCYMRTSEARMACDSYVNPSHPFVIPGLRNQTYRLVMTRKERYVVFPVLPVPFPQLPILTNGQWSILAALAAQRL
jgi:hypothetical protein